MLCSNCGKEIKQGLFGGNPLLFDDEIRFINSMLNKNSKQYCKSCGIELLEEAQKINTKINEQKRNISSKREIVVSEIQKLSNELNKIVDNIPVLTTHTPYDWEYTSLGIVTGQVVTGTGLFSEIKSSITDFFGMQSGTFQEKLSISEKQCLNQMRIEAVKLGANAIIATDLDFGEVGGGKGMLMVCAAGTAVKLTNTNTSDEATKQFIKKFETSFEEYSHFVKILDMNDEEFIENFSKSRLAN